MTGYRGSMSRAAGVLWAMALTGLWGLTSAPSTSASALATWEALRRLHRSEPLRGPLVFPVCRTAPAHPTGAAAEACELLGLHDLTSLSSRQLQRAAKGAHCAGRPLLASHVAGVVPQSGQRKNKAP